MSILYLDSVVIRCHYANTTSGIKIRFVLFLNKTGYAKGETIRPRDRIGLFVQLSPRVTVKLEGGCSGLFNGIFYPKLSFLPTFMSFQTCVFSLKL